MTFFHKIRENLKDPKKKSITMLIIYGIFFIFVFILISNGNSTTYNYNEYIKEENINEITTYQYIYKINNNEVINEISGTYKDGEDIFNYNGLNYTKIDGIIYLNNNPVNNLDFDVDRYKYEKIELLMENSDSKTTYKDSNKIVYNINVNEYFTLLNEVNNCGVIDCTIIEIPVTVESDTYINHVIIDLSNYYGYKYNIEINYNSINAIEKISTN